MTILDSLQINLAIYSPESTDEEIDIWTRQLLLKLRELDVEFAGLTFLDNVIEGEKGVGIDPMFAEAIALVVLPTMLPKILEFLQAWSLQSKGRTIKFKGKMSGQNIEFEGSFAEMEKLIAMLEKGQKKKKNR